MHWDVPKPETHGAGLLTGPGSFEEKYEKLLPSLYRIEESWPIDPAEWTRWAEEQKKGDSVLWFTLEGFFWFPRTLFGIENHFYAFYDEPELMHRMNRDNADFMLRIIDRLCEICTPDFMTFAEDMSYNNGPMLSEELFDEFMLPYYQTRRVPVLKERGIIPVVDSDGDITRAIPWFERAGIDAILPLERQAGVDLQAIREKHPAFPMHRPLRQDGHAPRRGRHAAGIRTPAAGRATGRIHHQLRSPDAARGLDRGIPALPPPLSPNTQRKPAP